VCQLQKLVIKYVKTVLHQIVGLLVVSHLALAHHALPVVLEALMSTTGAYGSSLPSTEGAAGSSPYATTVQYPTDGVVASAPPPSYDEACSGYAKKI
jgi:spore maturation protein SpmB